jgi:hypothetical protein
MVALQNFPRRHLKAPIRARRVSSFVALIKGARPSRLIVSRRRAASMDAVLSPPHTDGRVENGKETFRPFPEKKKQRAKNEMEAVFCGKGKETEYSK